MFFDKVIKMSELCVDNISLTQGYNSKIIKLKNAYSSVFYALQ